MTDTRPLLDAQPPDSLVAFIAYARDGRGEAFSSRLREWLPRRGVTPWMDEDLFAGDRIPGAIRQKVTGADVVLFVMTPRSVEGGHWCEDEIELARSRGRPVIPLRIHPDADRHMLLRNVPVLSFVGGREADGWAALGESLARWATPEGRRRRLELQRQALQREAAAAGASSVLFKDLLEEINRELEALDRPAGGRSSTARSEPVHDAATDVETRIVLYRSADRPSQGTGGAAATVPSSGEPPAIPANRWQDRASEINDLEARLGDPSVGLVTLTGRAGLGKTALVSRLWQRIRSGDSRLAVHVPAPALVYRSARQFRPITAEDLLRTVARMITDRPGADRARAALDRPLPWIEKSVAVLDALGDRPVLVVIDNIEDLLDTDEELADPSLRELIDHWVPRSGHAVKVVLVGRDAPRPLLRRNSTAAFSRDLESGIPPEHFRELLRGLERPGRTGWADGPQEELDELYRLTGGSPRAVELAHGIGGSSPLSAMLDLLQVGGRTDPVRHLFTWYADKLPEPSRKVLQALAVLGRPVRPETVDHLLEAFSPTVPSSTILGDLNDRGVVRHDGDAFYLPTAPEGQHVLGTIPPGYPEDRSAAQTPYTRVGLFHRAAAHFAEQRPTADPDRIQDLAAALSQAEMLVRGGDHRQAVRLMRDLQERYLSGWGYSGALVPPLRRLLDAEDLPRSLRMDASSLMADCYQRQEDYRQAQKLAQHALDLASSPFRMGDRVAILQQLAAAQAELGSLHEATRTYRRARRIALVDLWPQSLSWAVGGVGLCLAWQGRFGPALRRLALADALLWHRTACDARRQRLIHLVNRSWIHGQLGDRDRVRACVDALLPLAVELGEERLEGAALLHEAEMLLDQRSPHLAVQKAEEAAGIGLRHDNRSLCRDAKEVAALGYLCMDRLDLAHAAVTVARRHRCSPRGLGLAALVAYRREEWTEARAAFRECRAAVDRLCRWPDDRDYQLLDLRGLANCGAALLDEPPALARSVASYRAARRLTAAAGVLRRNELLLQQFGLAAADPDLLQVVRRAALGVSARSVK